MVRRAIFETLLRRAEEPRRFIQVLAGARQDGNHWGRLVESAIGAHLLNSGMGSGLEVAYWRDRNQEVDFVLRREKTIVALEVKSGRGKDTLPGMAAFARQFKPKRQLLVGGQGVPLEEFLSEPVGHWLK